MTEGEGKVRELYLVNWLNCFLSSLSGGQKLGYSCHISSSVWRAVRENRKCSSKFIVVLVYEHLTTYFIQQGGFSVSLMPRNAI